MIKQDLFPRLGRGPIWPVRQAMDGANNDRESQPPRASAGGHCPAYQEIFPATCRGLVVCCSTSSFHSRRHQPNISFFTSSLLLRDCFCSKMLQSTVTHDALGMASTDGNNRLRNSPMKLVAS